MSAYKEYEPLLTQKAIRRGIWEAIKTKTNYTLLDQKNKTGGIFVDSIWLRENYSGNAQKVIGKLIEDVDTNSTYVTGILYNSLFPIPTATVNINDDLGLQSNTTLRKLPMADAKLVLSKLIYEDAKLLSLYSKIMNEEMEIEDFRNQKMLLNGYDILENGETSSSIYVDNLGSPLTYDISGSSFRIANSNFTYYPRKILLKTESVNQRYTVEVQEGVKKIVKIDNEPLTEGIPIDFDFVPNYTITILELA